MARPVMILVSDDREQCERARTTGSGMGFNVQAFTWHEWSRNLQDPSFRQGLMGEVPALAFGSSPVDSGAKILQFPVGGAAGTHGQDDKKVRTINELESIAIENAIHEYHGNLTEAAKALGIGRATLYRKVKQYNIDPTSARKRRAA